MNGTAVQISGYVSMVGPLIFYDVELRLVNIPWVCRCTRFKICNITTVNLRHISAL